MSAGLPPNLTTSALGFDSGGPAIGFVEASVLLCQRYHSFLPRAAAVSARFSCPLAAVRSLARAVR